ncbi:GNAT family N-acetyltransferase [Nocardioides sp.]|uniref:GNAT family N-acetyltransferase n=1 Tax=Nocardioides sp. TaxID=35761 RepID=UPI0035140107
MPPDPAAPAAPADAEPPVELRRSEELDAADRAALRLLWDRAFSDFTDDDAAHAVHDGGGLHALVRHAGVPVAHASVVPRRLRFGAGPWREVGYVEAVAVDPDHQRRGLGRRVMLALHPAIAARWPVALLSTGKSTGFYARLGWERWGGLSFTRLADGTEVADDEHGGLMILRCDPTVVPDLRVDVTCEDRSGDAW